MDSPLPYLDGQGDPLDRKEVFGMMSTGDVARYMGVSLCTVRNWVEQGYLPVTMKTPTGYLKFDESDVERLRENCIKNGRGLCK